MPLPLPSAAERRVHDAILRAVRDHTTFFLTGHEHPDGDTIGSELAMASFLRRRGKRVTIANVYPPPMSYGFLPGLSSLRVAKKLSGSFDVAIVFECADPERMGNIIDLTRQAKVVINIDHHVHHGLFGHINLINPHASSNAEQLATLFERAGHRLNRAEATALYVGLVTDSGRFQYESTSPASHDIAAHLLRTGVDVARINERLFSNRSVKSLALLARALGGLRLVAAGRVSILTLRRSDFAAVGAADGDVEDIVNYGLCPPSVVVALLFREDQDGRIKVSARGKGRVNLCDITVPLGGGGHKNAAGVTLTGGIAAVEKTILTATQRVLRRTGGKR